MWPLSKINRHLRIVLALSCLIPLLFVGCQKDLSGNIAPKAINGVLDLSNWDLDRDGPVDLSGEWEFYWNQLINPNEFSTPNPPQKASIMSVPGCWNDYLFEGQLLPGKGYATYRLRVLLNDQKGRFAFNIMNLATAFTVYANGERVGSAGVLGKSIEASAPGFAREIIKFSSEKNSVEIVIQVSNFHHRLGGPWEVIRMGRLTAMQKIQERSLALDLFLCGSILIIGLYHLFLFFLRKTDRSPLYFSIFCGLVAVRLLVTGERYLTHLVPGISWELVIKIEYLAFYLAVPVFAAFCYTLFYRDVSKGIIQAIQLTGIFFCGIVLVTTAGFYPFPPLFDGV